jgi:hypothetical protein
MYSSNLSPELLHPSVPVGNDPISVVKRASKAPQSLKATAGAILCVVVGVANLLPFPGGHRWYGLGCLAFAALLHLFSRWCRTRPDAT